MADKVTNLGAHKPWCSSVPRPVDALMNRGPYPCDCGAEEKQPSDPKGLGALTAEQGKLIETLLDNYFPKFRYVLQGTASYSVPQESSVRAAAGELCAELLRRLAPPPAQDVKAHEFVEKLWHQASVWDLDVPEDRQELERLLHARMSRGGQEKK